MWKWNYRNVENFFGFSLSSVGDVNGDGFDDIIVGVPYRDGSGIDVGRAYIFLGGLSMNNIADITFPGEANYNYFGWSVLLEI